MFVDVGLCELWMIGWMYNCVWMVVVLFLIKYLLIDWCVGEVWFCDMLVDVDFVNNVVSW